MLAPCFYTSITSVANLAGHFMDDGQLICNPSASSTLSITPPQVLTDYSTDIEFQVMHARYRLTPNVLRASKAFAYRK